MRTLTVSVTEQQASRLRQAVEAGGYASDSDIVRDALSLWERREELRKLETQRLKQAYQEGIASGTPQEIDAKAMLATLKAERRSRG